MARGPARERRLRFSFQGWRDGWYVLRLPTRGHAPLALHGFRNAVVEWLIEQDITPNDLSYLANGNTGDGPPVPATDGDALCLLLRRAADVLRFERAFGCRGITPEAIFAALRAEASVHRFVLLDLVTIVYDAIRRFILVFGDAYPEWEDRSDDEQRLFLQRVQEFAEQPNRSAADSHMIWVDRRLAEGWRYAPEINLRQHRHPLLVPFAKLPEREQALTRLTASVVESLAPLLRRPVAK